MNFSSERMGAPKAGRGEVVPRPLDSVVTQNERKFFPKDSLRFLSI